MRKVPLVALARIASISIMFLCLSCTNADLEMLNKRVEENLSGTLYHPGDIDPPGTNNFTFSVLGDTHVGSPGSGVFKPMLQRSLADGDAFTIIAGDLTNTATSNQFNTFKQIMTDVGFGNFYRTTVGNHDLFFGGWEHYKQSLGRSMYSFDADNVHFTMIDSGNGAFGKKQLEWIKADLASTIQPIKIVVTHFPPWESHFGGLYRISSDEEIAIFKNIMYDYNVAIMIAAHYHAHADKTFGRTRYIVTGGANDILDPSGFQHYMRFTVTGNSITTQVVRYP